MDSSDSGRRLRRRSGGPEAVSPPGPRSLPARLGRAGGPKNGRSTTDRHRFNPDRNRDFNRPGFTQPRRPRKPVSIPTTYQARNPRAPRRLWRVGGSRPQRPHPAKGHEPPRTPAPTLPLRPRIGHAPLRLRLCRCWPVVAPGQPPFPDCPDRPRCRDHARRSGTAHPRTAHSTAAPATATAPPCCNTRRGSRR